MIRVMVWPDVRNVGSTRIAEGDWVRTRKLTEWAPCKTQITVAWSQYHLAIAGGCEAIQYHLR